MSGLCLVRLTGRPSEFLTALFRFFVSEKTYAKVCPRFSDVVRTYAEADTDHDPHFHFHSHIHTRTPTDCRSTDT